MEGERIIEVELTEIEKDIKYRGSPKKIKNERKFLKNIENDGIFSLSIMKIKIIRRLI
jgi:hypothetical protein